MRGRPKTPVTVSKSMMNHLESMIEDEQLSEKVRLRCRLVRDSLAGESNSSIASRYKVSARTVANWTERFAQGGTDTFHDHARSGRPKCFECVLSVSKEQADKLQLIVRRRKTDQQTALRARIILMSAERVNESIIAQKLDTTVQTVRKWQKRFAEQGMAALADLARPGPNRTITDAQVEEVVTLTLESIPEGATHWSTRSMAQKCGISRHSVMRIWHAFELKPHLQQKFQLSTDPFFVEKVRDVVGLYMSPPENAIVLCVDEKSQIQALERSQPVLPLRPRRVQRASHDYYRHGTVRVWRKR